MRVVSVTEKMGDVPETEPRPELPVLPVDEPIAVTRDKRVEETFRNLRYRAHRYHGVTRMDPPVAKLDVDKAASELARAAIKFTHAYEPHSAKVDPEHPEKGCVCIFCV